MTVAVVGVFSLSACGFIFPTRPDTSGNVSLTVGDGNLVVVQCVFPALSLDSLSVSTAGDIDVRGDNRTIYTGSANPPEREIYSGEKVALNAPVEGLVTVEVGDPSISTIEPATTVYVTIAGDEGRIDQSFDNVDPQVLKDGRFLYRNGETGTEPCSDGE